MKILNQKGIAMVAILVAVVVVIAAGLVTFVVLKQKDGGTTSKSEESSQEGLSENEKAAITEAKDHFKLLEAGKVDEAYETTCGDFKNFTTHEQFTDLVENDALFKIELSKVDYDNNTVTDNQAQLSGPLGSDAPGQNLNVDLLNENGSWCVYGYRVDGT